LLHDPPKDALQRFARLRSLFLVKIWHLVSC